MLPRPGRHRNDYTAYHSSSLLALYELGQKHGYSMVATGAHTCACVCICVPARARDVQHETHAQQGTLRLYCLPANCQRTAACPSAIHTRCLPLPACC